MTDRVDSEIRPALTAEEWKFELGSRERPPTHQPALSYSDHFTQERPHAIAASLLYGQPFGFTWDDVDLLREMTLVQAPAGSFRAACERRDSLADRIAALLPPRT
jgi:hypothetical protein